MKKEELRDAYFKAMYDLYMLLMRRVSLHERADDYGILQIAKKSNKHKLTEKVLAGVQRKIARQEKKLAALSRRAKRMKTAISIERIAEDHGLNRDEKLIIIVLLFALLTESNFRSHVSGGGLLQACGYDPHEFIRKCIILCRTAKLRAHDLIRPHRGEDESIFETRFTLTTKALKLIFEQGLLPEVDSDIRDENDCLLTVREPAMTFDQLILEPRMQESIIKVVTQIEKVRTHLREWDLEKMIAYGKAASMLFYGPPGTGKTATCEAIAQRMGKKVGIANYAQIVNKWLGNSEKNIVRVFDEAKHHNCVLVFDEADALFGKRLESEENCGRTYNIITNLLMQQMEQFDGTVILTTNRQFKLDEAFERRILLKLNFGVPTARDRARIWRTMFTDKVPLARNVDFEELGRRFDIAGGTIKNVVLKAVYECAYTGKPITMDDLVSLAMEEMTGYDKKKVGFDI